MPEPASASGSGAIRLLDLRETPLSVDEVLAAVADPAAGGTTIFVGTVRDHDQASDRVRGVTRLDYTAHSSARQALDEVAAEIVAEFPITALAATHRTGQLQVGEIAVVVAASAPHRDQAFAASRALIDRLKERVPIWKHQLFDDGSDAWVGVPDPGLDHG